MISEKNCEQVNILRISIRLRLFERCNPMLQQGRRGRRHARKAVEQWWLLRPRQREEQLFACAER